VPTPTAVVRRDSSRPDSEDRVEVRAVNDSLLVAVADGAGGTGGGGAAATLAVRMILGTPVDPDPVAWVRCLAEVDRRLSEEGSGGETTAVAALITRDSIVGASVGDSGAWLVYDDDYENLTRRQQRKPLLGSGVAVPVMFTSAGKRGTLLVATDGLLKYTSPEKICETIRRHPGEEGAKLLIDLVRLKSGSLQDDVALVLASAPVR
jgi:serine/threonine protein phosphatase PrpC